MTSDDKLYHLHTVFHEIGRLGKVGDWWWSDNPSSNIRGWAERHDDFAEAARVARLHFPDIWARLDAAGVVVRLG